MRAHIYEVAKGNEVPTQFHGKEVQLNRAETVEECVSSGHFENLAAVAAAAEAQWLIGARAAIRTELGREPEKGKESEFVAPTLESASTKGNAVKLGAPREAREAKPRTPQGEARKVQSEAGNAMFEGIRNDETKRARLFKLFPEQEAAYNLWLEAQAKVAAAAQKTADGAAK